MFYRYNPDEREYGALTPYTSTRAGGDIVVVYEIKNPTPPRPAKLVPEEKVLHPIIAASAIARVKRFKKEVGRKLGGEKRDRDQRLLTSANYRTLREMVEHVNSNLEKNGILVHLVLSKDADGLAVDVYDCTSNQVCEIVSDIVIALDDLPLLIRKLQQETGFVVDTIS